jgi:tetratricopeptide (TPR) repeat protein
VSKALYPHLAIFLLALLARGVYLVELADTPLVSVLLGDGRQYHAWAAEIAAGDWIGGEVFYQAPLYPYFIAAVMTVFGPGTWALRVLQALMGAAACVLVALAGRRFFLPRAGIAAGALLALYPPALFFDGLVQKTSLGLFLTAALLWLAGEAAREGAPATWFTAAGAVLGGLALTRENALVLVPVLLVWILCAPGPPRRRGARTALFVLGLALVLVPVGLRNLAIGGRFLVTTAQLGPNFYIGNNPEANGRYRPLRPGRQDARVERADAVELAESAVGRSLDPAEVSSYWRKRSLAYVRENPGDWAGLLLTKAFLVAGAAEVVDTESIEVYREHSRLLDVLARVFHFGVLGPLAVLGVWATRREWRRLWVLYAMAAAMAASLVLFYVVARYRFSLVPIAVLFAAAALVELVERCWARPRSPAPLVPGIALAALAAVVQNWPLGEDPTSRATTYYNLGVSLFEAGDDTRAPIYFEKALALVPDFAEGHHSLGKALAAGGDVAGAVDHYERAVALDPDHAEAHFNLGYSLMTQGRLEGAARHLERCVALDPAQPLARNFLGNVLAQQGEIAAAVELYEAALRLDPGLADAHFKLGRIHAGEGRLDEARRHLEATVRLLPDFAEARERLAAVIEAQATRGGGE